jgi:hypothetical protein
MVEAVDVCPRPHVVAGFTTKSCAVGTALRHAVLELTVVRIGMTRCAAHILKMEGQDLVGPARRSRLVAIGAGDSGVGSGQSEPSVAMLRNGKERTVKIAHGMAIFAFVQVWHPAELAVMRILVTVRAQSEFHVVNRVLAGRKMALRAFDGNVFAS